MKLQNILYEKSEAIATIILNRPEKLNALDLKSYAELDQAFDTADADPQVRVVIITGAGERAFCSGDDISIFPKASKNPRGFIKKVMPAMMKVEKMDKPVVAAVNGFALGGGMELAMACDVVIAAENATFGLPEGRMGLMPALAVLRLSQITGAKRAAELMFSGENFTAQKALEIGLASQVVPLAQLRQAARNMAKKFMSVAPLSTAAIKATINRRSGGEELAFVLEAVTKLFETQDHKEAVAAFQEKRKPQFRGK